MTNFYNVNGYKFRISDLTKADIKNLSPDVYEKLQKFEENDPDRWLNFDDVIKVLKKQNGFVADDKKNIDQDLLNLLLQSSVNSITIHDPDEKTKKLIEDLFHQGYISTINRDCQTGVWELLMDVSLFSIDSYKKTLKKQSLEVLEQKLQKMGFNCVINEDVIYVLNIPPDHWDDVQKEAEKYGKILRIRETGKMMYSGFFTGERKPEGISDVKKEFWIDDLKEGEDPDHFDFSKIIN